MPKKSFKTGGTTSIKRLFLICPTDNMERPILKYFIGGAFFYTALGAYFEFDYRAQSNLWDLICEHRIEKIVFVTSINNVFYQDVFNKNVNHNYPVNKLLSEAKKKISKQLIQPEVFSSNFHLLVANHLNNQIQRLLSTPYLGSRLREEKITVAAYVYEPEKKIFSSYREIEKIGYLVNSISYN